MLNKPHLCTAVCGTHSPWVLWWYHPSQCCSARCPGPRSGEASQGLQLLSASGPGAPALCHPCPSTCPVPLHALPQGELLPPERQDRLLKLFALRPSASAAPKDEKAASPPEVGEERDLHPLLQFLPLNPRGSTQGSGSGMGPRGRFSRVPRPEICSLAQSKLSRPPRCALHSRLQAGCTQRWGGAVLLPCGQAPEGQRLSVSRRSPPALPQPTAWT